MREIQAITATLVNGHRPKPAHLTTIYRNSPSFTRSGAREGVTRSRSNSDSSPDTGFTEPTEGLDMYDSEAFFKARLAMLRAEGRYRHFADLERRAGAFPSAFQHELGRT